MTPSLSVVIPVFNRVGAIEASIQSVLSQADESVEVVVVDDGSTDGTSGAVRSVVDDRVVLVERGHAGVSAARNAGVDAARAPFVVFLDSDDLALEGWVRTFTRAAREGYDLFSCAMLERDIAGCDVCAVPGDLGAASGGLTSHYQAGAFGVRRAVFLEVGGYSSRIRLGEGTQLLFSLGRRHLDDALKVGFTSSALVVVHRQPRAYDAASYYESGRATLDESHDMLARDPRLLGVNLFVTAVAAWRCGRRSEGIRLLAGAARHNPQMVLRRVLPHRKAQEEAA